MLVRSHSGEHGGVGGQGDRGENRAGLPRHRAFGRDFLQRRCFALGNDRRFATVDADDEDMLRTRRGNSLTAEREGGKKGEDGGTHDDGREVTQIAAHCFHKNGRQERFTRLAP